MGGEKSQIRPSGAVRSTEPGIQAAVWMATPTGFRAPARGRPRNDAALDLLLWTIA
jgi:hypothetical protein